MAIPASELLQIQKDLNAQCLDKSCVIRHKTTTSGTAGEPLASYASPGVTVKCAMHAPSPSQLAQYATKIGSSSAWIVRLPVGTSVSEQDWIVAEGITMVIQDILDPHTVPGLLSILGVSPLEGN